MQAALEWLWQFTDEMFEVDALTMQAVEALGITPIAEHRHAWDSRIDGVLAKATLARPVTTNQRSGGRSGRHSEHLGHLLAEMQWMQRSYPGLAW
jgi:ring-1,2-phenylacetyl-CoA epoxidase subunit PaaC